MPIDIVIKKLRVKLGPNPFLCSEDDRIQITQEGNGNLFASVEHDLEENTTWLGLYSDELDMDFDVNYNAKSGKILRDKNVKAVNAMIKFTTPESFVETISQKFIKFNDELLVARNSKDRNQDEQD